MNVEIRPLEEQYGDIIRLQFRRLVADVHPYAIYGVLAVSLDDELTARRRNRAEQASESCLSARMEMDLRLL